MEVVSRSSFFPEVGPGIKVAGNSFYTRASGVDKMRTRNTVTQSDKADTSERSFSQDNGRTWSDPEPVEFIFQVEGGTLRTGTRPGLVDPVRDCVVELVTNALLPTDSPKEGLRTRYFSYRVSLDGCRTYEPEEPVIQRGPYDEQHPLEGVWRGKNGVTVGDLTCRPVRTHQDRLLFPIQIAPLGPDGEYYNPGGGYTYGEAAVLIGTWDSGERIIWDLSERVIVPPQRSTRGLLEPTIAQMPDGRLLMLMRGSNDVKPEIPGYRWRAVSTDDGYTWCSPEPWTYDDGETFHSPSSCSQLLPHSSGRYFWLGNITPHNPRGNWPRYPLVMGEVDPQHLTLRRDSVLVVDDRGTDDHERLALSNFMAHEDRETGEVLLHMSRAFQHGDRTSAAYQYRIAV